MNIPFIKYSKVWLVIASLTMVICAVLLVRFGLKPGIDFTGGSLLELSFSQTRATNEDTYKTLKEFGLNDIVIQKSGDTDLIIRTNFLNEEDHQSLLIKLREQYQTDANRVTETRFETIGAAIS